METQSANRLTPEPEIRRALNAKADGSAVRAFCMQLPETIGSDLPEWIPYLPAPDAKGRVIGEDGRAWTIKNPRALAASWKRKLPIDVNHSNDIKAPKGEESPAFGHILGFEAREDNSIWAKTSWNSLGERALRNREYAFISPAFDFNKSDEIVVPAGASLVNHPNFTSLALNSQQSTEEFTMPKLILAALGLPETATEDEAVRAINTQKDELQRAVNARATPDLQRFVPRADYEALQTRATNAEQKNAEVEKARHQAAVDSEIKAALEAGKITPATETFYRATCSSEQGLTDFRAFVQKAAPVVSDGSQGHRPPPKQGEANDPNVLATRALNYQKEQEGLGRSISIAQAMTHITSQEQ